MKKSKNMRIHAERRLVNGALCAMPPLPHWPNRAAPFEREKSEVLRWIVALFPELMPRIAAFDRPEQFAEANRIMCAAEKRKPPELTFDPETKLWCGSAFDCLASKSSAGESE